MYTVYDCIRIPIYTYIVITRGLEWVVWHCSDAPKQQTYCCRNLRQLGSVIVSICLPSKQDINGPIKKAPVICRHEDHCVVSKCHWDGKLSFENTDVVIVLQTFAIITQDRTIIELIHLGKHIFMIPFCAPKISAFHALDIYFGHGKIEPLLRIQNWK